MMSQDRFARLGGIRPAIGNRAIPMTEDELRMIEQQIGVALPEEYRDFLAMHGASSFRGASPDNPWIVFRPVKPLPASISSTGDGLLDVLYGSAQMGNEAVSLLARIRFYAGRLPLNMIPIGDDGIGNQILLGVKGKERGKVYFWDQQNEPPDEDDYFEDYRTRMPDEIRFRNLHPVADSFGDFLRRLDLKRE